MNMSAGKLTTLVVASALLVPAGLTAQQGHEAHHPQEGSADTPRAGTAPGMRSGSCPMMGGGMMKGGGMMSSGMGMAAMQSGPRMLLRQQEALKLTGDQVGQLEQLQARAEELRSSHRSQMASVQEQLQALRKADELDLERYESLLRKRADLGVERQVQRAEFHRDALAVLDEEQRSELGGAKGMMGAHGGMSGDGSGMRGMMKNMHGPEMMQMMKKMHQRMHEQECPMMGQDGEGEG
jgi:hypothetical protein